jgi:hypothetical protein
MRRPLVRWARAGAAKEKQSLDRLMCRTDPARVSKYVNPGRNIRCLPQATNVTRQLLLLSLLSKCFLLATGKIRRVMRAEPLALGDLGGNAFEITLRGVSRGRHVGGGEGGGGRGGVEIAIEALAASGFVNYFGLQRIGRFEPGSFTLRYVTLRYVTLRYFIYFGLQRIGRFEPGSFAWCI